MFKCHWYDTRRGIRMHRSNGLVEIKHTSRLYGNEDFVLAQHVNKSVIHVHLIINLLNGGQLLRQLLEVAITLT
jgi:hypothetical protein